MVVGEDKEKFDRGLRRETTEDRKIDVVRRTKGTSCLTGAYRIKSEKYGGPSHILAEAAFFYEEESPEKGRIDISSVNPEKTMKGLPILLGEEISYGPWRAGAL